MVVATCRHSGHEDRWEASAAIVEGDPVVGLTKALGATFDFRPSDAIRLATALLAAAGEAEPHRRSGLAQIIWDLKAEASRP